MLNVHQRKRLYAFFSRLFSYPDRQLATVWDEEFTAALPLDPAPPKLPPLRELEIAFTGLFINRLGGAPAPPFGSVYLDQESGLMGESTRRVAEHYRQNGLKLEGSSEPPDYLPTELEYLFFQVEREESALRNRDVNAAREAGMMQAHFCRQFFLPWVQQFCSRLAAVEEVHPFYRWGGKMLESFCRSEQEWLSKMYPAQMKIETSAEPER